MMQNYNPNFLNRLSTSLKWKSSEQSFSSSPGLKCFATSGSGSGFLGHHFAPTPNINRRAMGTGGLTRDHACAPEGAAYGGCKGLGLMLAVLRFHDFVSSS